MFKFFKDKLKEAVERFSKKVDEESETVEEPAEEEKTQDTYASGKAEQKKGEETAAVDEKVLSEESEELPVTREKAAEVEEIEKLADTELKSDIEEVSEEIESDKAAGISEEPSEEPSEEIPKGISEEISEEIKGPAKKIIPSAKKPEAVSKLKEIIKEEEPSEEDTSGEDSEAAQVHEDDVDLAGSDLAGPDLVGLGQAGSVAQHEEDVEEEVSAVPEKKGFFDRIRKAVTETVTKATLSESKFADIFWDLEIVLLENNVAVEVIDKIRDDLKERLVDTKVSRSNLHYVIQRSLYDSISEVLSIEPVDLLKEIKKVKGKRPYVIVFVGINGSGKTTTIAKLAHLLKENKISSVMAAADTFRAAAIQQLEEHADRLKVKLIKHDYGSDPAAVAFDAISYAKAKNVDVVLVDTAGRLQSNKNLMQEMEKITRVAKPDMKLFVGESITGNDCVEQARQFNEAVSIDGIILSKADIDEKGGAAISVSYVTGKPILYIGTGQEYGDIKEFTPDSILKTLGLE